MSVATDPTIPPMEIDRSLLRQAVLNLIKNGLEAVSQGGTLTRDDPASGRRVELSVSDTGPGISPDVGPRLFEQFFTTKPQGTGLGLSITRQIVEEHGGTIRWTARRARARPSPRCPSRGSSMPDASATPATLLVADDDPAVRQSLERTLTREGYAVVLAPDGQAALERLRAGGIDLVLTDLKMPGLTGLEFLARARRAPDVDFILLTAFGTVEEAVKAMKDGAIDFITKPFQRAQLIKVVRQALERRALIAQNRALQQRLDALLGQGHMIGVSPAFRRMMTLVDQVANSSATVLIQGESGTGKELVARSLHDRSQRRNGPFVAVNCAALPETLLESELFGYEKGAFTGAAERKEGRFELADGGTLFLDEMADLSPVTQPKLLRVLQEGEFERVGGTKTIRVDVRIVAATNQDLAGARAREALPRRPVLPAERHHARRAAAARAARGHPVLAQHFLRSTPRRTTASSTGFSEEALDASRPTRGPATCASSRT